MEWADAFCLDQVALLDNPAGDQNQGHLLAHDIDAEMLAVAIWTASPQLSSHLEHDR